MGGVHVGPPELESGVQRWLHQERLREPVLIGLKVKPGKWEVMGDTDVLTQMLMKKENYHTLLWSRVLLF